MIQEGETMTTKKAGRYHEILTVSTFLGHRLLLQDVLVKLWGAFQVLPLPLSRCFYRRFYMLLGPCHFRP